MNSRIVFLSMMLLSECLLSAASGKDEAGFPKIKGWKLNVSSDVYTPDNLWNLINGAAESYLSYEFQDLHLADYLSKEDVEIHAEVYRHSSPVNAFGIYSSERSPEYNFIEIGTQGYQDQGILNFLSGTYYVKLYSTGEGEKVQSALFDIGKALADHLGGENSWPAILELFPPEGKISKTDHYVRENFIGLNFLHSAYTAEYEGGYRLFVVEGEDHAEIMEMVRAYLKFTKQDTDPEAKNSFVIRDRYNGDIPVIINGSYLLGIIDGSENEAAKAGLAELESKISVTQ